jgi:uncharacterized protein with HEPN domain
MSEKRHYLVFLDDILEEIEKAEGFIKGMNFRQFAKAVKPKILKIMKSAS